MYFDQDFIPSDTCRVYSIEEPGANGVKYKNVRITMLRVLQLLPPPPPYPKPPLSTNGACRSIAALMSMPSILIFLVIFTDYFVVYRLVDDIIKQSKKAQRTTKVYLTALAT